MHLHDPLIFSFVRPTPKDRQWISRLLVYLRPTVNIFRKRIPTAGAYSLAVHHDAYSASWCILNLNSQTENTIHNIKLNRPMPSSF